MNTKDTIRMIFRVTALVIIFFTLLSDDFFIPCMS
jgi:hypothetical protein